MTIDLTKLLQNAMPTFSEARLGKIVKGDVKGHDFHGNQWVQGEAGSGWKPLSSDEYAKGILQERLDAVERACKGEDAAYRERITPVILSGSPETVLAQAKKIPRVLNFAR